MKIKELKEKDLFYKDIDFRIDAIKGKKNLYVISFRITKIIVFLAGAAITILTGWKASTNCNFDPNNWILTISAGITVFAAMEGLFDFKDKGKSYDIFLFDLRRLRDKMCFDFVKDPNLYEKNKDEYFKEYLLILESQKTIIENSDSGEE